MKNLKNKIKSMKGITLISLVVTIIILIIISSVSIGIILGNNGLIDRTKTAKSEYQNSVNEENRKLEEIYSKLLLATTDSTTLENIDMITLKQLILDSTYPIGSIYITIGESNPATLLGGTWEQIEEGRVLQTVKSSQTSGTTLDAGLPNIYGSIGRTNKYGNSYTTFSGLVSGTLSTYYLTHTNNSTGSADRMVEQTFDASKANSIYGNSNTVQPPAYLVYMWKRTK